jgi:hypothetical protein
MVAASSFIAEICIVNTRYRISLCVFRDCIVLCSVTISLGLTAYSRLKVLVDDKV